MKRVSFPDPPRELPSWLKELDGETSTLKRAVQDTLELPAAKKHKPDPFVSADGLIGFAGMPMSPAEILNLLMQAKGTVELSALVIMPESTNSGAHNSVHR